MFVLMNENMLKLALSSIKEKISLLNRINNKLIRLLLLSLIGYEEVLKILKKKMKSLKASKRGISSLISLGNGNIVSGSNDKVLTVWNLNSFECTKTLTDTNVIGYNNIQYTFSHDKIELWGMDDFKCLKTIKLEERFLVYSSLVLSNGNIAVVPLEDSRFISKMILILDSSNNFKLMKIITEHQSVVYSFVNLSDNKFASGCTCIRIWCNINYTCLKTLTYYGKCIYALLYLTNNNTLLSGSFDKTIKIWECNNYLCIKDNLCS
jgi:WD40 repeat protein